MFHGPFRATRPRHPLARLAMSALGVIAVLLFVALGMFALAALAIGGALLLLVNALRSTPRPRAHAGAAASPAPPPPDVIEGEFKIVSGAPAQRDPSTAPH
jgi:hypothetical protein